MNVRYSDSDPYFASVDDNTQMKSLQNKRVIV